jgi:hypothetical protein
MNSKSVIEPLQEWLLDEKVCIGCGRSLEGVRKEHKKRMDFVKCVCNRVFIWEADRDSFRRAYAQDLR